MMNKIPEEWLPWLDYMENIHYLLKKSYINTYKKTFKLMSMHDHIRTGSFPQLPGSM